MYQHKKRMLVKTYFKLRILQKDRLIPASVVCVIKINGEDSTPFSVGVFCLVTDWNYQFKRINATTAKSYLGNSILDRVEREINELCTIRSIQNLPVTAKIIHKEYTKPLPKIPKLLELIQARIDKSVDKKRSESTIKMYKSYKNVLRKYIESIGKNDIAVHELDSKMWNEISRNTVRCKNSNYVLLKFIKSVLTFGISQDYFDKHPLLFEENEKDKKKDKVYIDELKIQNLIDTNFNSKLFENYRLAFIFQCFTGLAFAELKSFDKTKNIVKINGKDFLLVFRGKTSKSISIPILKQAREVLEKMENKFTLKDLNDYNICIRFFGEIINFDNVSQLSSHKGRVTAGYFLLNNGVPIEVVSKILGHSSIITTQQMYADILVNYIDSTTSHLQ